MAYCDPTLKDRNQKNGAYMNEKELVEMIDERTKDFSGQLNELENAIGMLMIGRMFGWKPLLLIHDKSTIKKYEKILDLNIREVLPEVGEYANKSLAWKAVQKVTNFWKAVKGEVPGIRTNQIEA